MIKWEKGNIGIDFIHRLTSYVTGSHTIINYTKGFRLNVKKAIDVNKIKKEKEKEINYD